jgi:hypothetical protein
MVLQIRKLRPDVIITNHSTTSNDHGQHQATALMVVEAFDAAADATKFPEQLKDGVTTWQVQRLFVRQRGNQAANTSASVVTIDPNEQDPVRGVVFAEQALHALQQHATQGPWPKSFAEYANRFRAFSGQNAPTGQLPMIRYALVKSATGAAPMPTQESHTFLDGLVLSDESLRQLTPLMMSNPPLTTPENAFALLNDKDVFAKLSALAKAYHQLHRPTTTIPQMINVRENFMDERLNIALARAAGIEVTVTSDGDAVVPGTPAKFVITIANHGSQEARLYGVGIHGMGVGELRGEPSLLPPGKTTAITRTLETRQTENVTVPHAEHLYDGREFGETFTATINLSVQGNSVWSIQRTAVDVAPPVEITSVNPQPLVVRPVEVGASSAGVDIIPARFPNISMQLVNHLNQPFRGEIVYGQEKSEKEGLSKVELLAHQNTTVALSIPNTNKSIAAHVRSAAAPPESFLISVRSSSSPKSVTEIRIPLVSANARVARNLRVGYIRGFDFSLPNALNALGVESKELSVDDVKTGDLSKFTSLIVDNRVYESKPELIVVNQRLLDYAQAGGNLIVFYHKSDEWNPDERRNRPQLAPYKLILGGERVTDENAPITFIEPDHPLLNTPNKMGQDDFKNWIQERGLYYPKEWDPQFHALLQSNDPGENPLKGGLLVADYGKGHYIYTSMVWYRELRGGIPGAYRMLANMISYGR